MITGKRILLFSLALLFSANFSFAQKSPTSEADLKKQAEKLFEKESYQEAVPMYSQLLSLYPRDPVYNYRYGVCLIMSGQDKTGAASYLEVAARDQNTDPDVHFYLGRSYMFTDHFNEALSEFAQFKKTGSSAKQAKLNVDRLIENCNNANVLRTDRKNIVVLSKSKVNRSAFFAAYDFTEAAGKLLTTPDRFLTPIDKAKMPNPVMFMTRDGETIYFASYGKKGENGKDLYRLTKNPDGSWSEPSNLGGTVNTNADEDYAYLDKDGRTLYFSSTGHNSIGGYDIFKTQYDFNSGRWNDVVNVGIPINTVDDDLFFMPSTKGETAAYSTAVETEAGRIEYRNLGLGKSGVSLAVISGQYLSEDQVTRRDARITVIRNKDNGVVTSVKTDKTGQYELVLPTGEDYMLVVEGGSYLPHAENFSVPGGQAIPGMHQKVVMNKTSETESLTMSNFFTPSAIDASMASLEKPTQVTKSEFDIKDTATSKMQTITFEGRTLFVAPPSLPAPGLKTVDVDAMAIKQSPDATSGKEVNQQAADNQKSDASEKSSAESPTENTATPSSGNEKTDVASKTGTENVSGAVAVVPSTAKNSDAGKSEAKTNEAVATPSAVNEKTSNAELVKMAFDDAASVKDEATSLREDAIEKRLEARSLDSLSKEQIKQANQLIASGDADLSKEVFKQSQENVLSAQAKQNEAKSLDAAAHEKDLEYETSRVEAMKLMKEFKVDTNASAYQAIVVKDKEQEQNEAGEESPVAVANAHDVRSKQLAAQADSLFTESKYVEEHARTTSDKKQKAFLNDQAKDMNEQGESRLAESRLESGLADKEREQSLTATEPETKEVLASSQEDSQKENPVQSNAVESKKESGNVASAQEAASGNESDAGSTAESKSTSPAVKKETGTDVKSSSGNSVNPAMAVAVPVTTGTNASPSSPIVEKRPVKKSGPVVGLDPSAQQHYETYNEQLYESKQMEAASKETEAKLMSGNTPAMRDSLEAKTIELNKESIRLWQSSSKELAMAKEIDPQVEAKMKADEQSASKQSEQIVAEQKSQANNSAKENTEAGTGTGSETKTANTPAMDADVKVSPSVNTPLAKAENTQGTNEKLSAPAGNTSASGNAVQPSAAVEILDTTKPAYPEYVATQKAITEKQTETVNIFVEGMKLSKKATAIKKEEMSLRDQAVVNTDKKEKIKLEEKADSLAMEAQILTDKSNSMLAVAQKNTGEVKTLTAKSDKLKSELIVTPSVHPEATSSETIAAKEDSTPVQSNSSEQMKPAVSASGSLPSDSSVAMNTPSAVSQDEKNVPEENKTVSGQEENAAPKENPTQQENLSTENKPAEKNAEPGMQGEAGATSVTPVVTGSIASETKTDSPVDTSSAQNVNAETKTPTENGGSNEQTASAKEINPAHEEDPASALNETNTDVPPVEGQTRVEKEMNVSAQSPSKLVFKEETSDAVTFSLAKNNSVAPTDVIPMDPQLPEGLVFKVQIGAFRKPLPANAFNNLQPLSGETTRPGWIRYCLGLFRTFEPANLLKKEVRSMGYKDAFVVAYYNGKRIPLYDAYAMISRANAADKQTYATVSGKEFSQLEKFEIKKSNYDLKPDADSKAFYGTTENIPADLVEYAVQVGVYKTSRTPSALSSLIPLNTEQMSSGLYRFTTGRFDNRTSADSMKRVAVNTGIKDAFVVIYRGGRKAGQREAQQIAAATRKETSVTAPVITPSAVPAAPVSTEAPESVSPSDVVFKIQLGAFKENVPFNTVSSFLAIADKGITEETDARGLHIFYAGQYTNYNEALAARSEIASKGVKDAFIVAFVKGKRTSATDALKLLNRN